MGKPNIRVDCDEAILVSKTTAEIATQFPAIAALKYLLRNLDDVRADAIKDRMAGRFHRSVSWAIHPVDFRRVVRVRFWCTWINVVAAIGSRVQRGFAPPIGWRYSCTSLEESKKPFKFLCVGSIDRVPVVDRDRQRNCLALEGGSVAIIC